MDHERLIFAGTGNPDFAFAVADSLGEGLGRMSVQRFPDGEVSVKIEVNVRGRDCFVVQPACPPVNDNLMELLIILDALKRASTYRITAVVPYYGYARQDRKDQPRVPITAKLVADLLTRAGADRVLTMDLHAGQIQGFFDIPVDNLTAAPIFAKAVMALGFDEVVVASPDVGGVKNARSFARRLERMRRESGAGDKVDFAIVDKHRKGPDEVAALSIIGDVNGKSVVIIDDIIATGGSLVEAASLLLDKGAKEVVAVITHPILAGEAVQKVEGGRLTSLFVTDTVPLVDGVAGKIKVCSVAGLFGAAIDAIHRNRSISRLFDGG
ncbi:MAG: ribose-phosphate pyrophosphokinase [Candidatus Zixiibacteriota bacterium]|jgi:ribose-phosphate pyrophosphokinase